MSPKHLSVRMDRTSGALWLTEEKYRQKPRRIIELTNHIMLALCADLIAEDNTIEASREIRFNDGFTALVTVKDITNGPVEKDLDEAERHILAPAKTMPELQQDDEIHGSLSTL